MEEQGGGFLAVQQMEISTNERAGVSASVNMGWLLLLEEK